MSSLDAIRLVLRNDLAESPPGTAAPDFNAVKLAQTA
jgi:hypothetical protein